SGGQAGGVGGPPGQKGQRFGVIAGGLQQVIQGHGRKGLQKLQLAVQRLIQRRGQGPAGGAAGADVLTFQHGGGDVFAQVVGVGGEQRRLEPAGGLADGLPSLAPGQRPDQGAVVRQDGVVQQPAKDGQPCQPGADLFHVHGKSLVS